MAGGAIFNFSMFALALGGSFTVCNVRNARGAGNEEERFFTVGSFVEL